MALPAVIESGLNEAGTAVAVIVHPERGTGAIIEYVNQPFSAVMRRPEAELTGATFQRMLALVATAECRTQLVQSLQSGVPVQLDVPLMVGNVESWLGLRLSFPPPGVSGVRNAILIGRDITTARKNASQEDKMRQMLAQIFMRINAPVTIVGQAGQLVMCNTAFRHLTGFSAEELKQIRVQDLTPPDFVDALAEARKVQFTNGERYEMDMETLVKGGGRVAVRLTSVLLSDSEQQQYRVVTLIPRTVVDSDVAAAEAVALTAAVQACAMCGRGELRTISLEALRTSCGGDWERIAVRAMLRAEQTIRKRLDRDDVVSRLGESSFVLWFSSDDESRNALTLQALVRDVRLIFLTEFGDEISGGVSAATVPGVAAFPATAKAKPASVQYAGLQHAGAKVTAD